MRPQEFLELRDKKKKVVEAETELDNAREAAKKIENTDPGTPEEWENLTLDERFDDLFKRIKRYANHNRHEDGMEFDGQANARIVEVEHKGQRERMGLFFTLHQDIDGTYITATWSSSVQKDFDESLDHDELIYRLGGSELVAMGENTDNKIKAQLNKLYYSLQAYETGKEVLTS